MNILFVTLDSYPHHGGKSTHIRDLISGMESIDGVKAEVFSGNAISKKKLNAFKLLIYPLKYISLKKYVYLRKIMELKLFKSAIKKNVSKFDLFSAQDAQSATILGELGFKNIFLTMHTYFGLEILLDNKIFTEQSTEYQKLLKFELRSLQYVKGIVSVDSRISEHVNNTLKNLNLTTNIKTTSIQNFVNTQIMKKNQLLPTKNDLGFEINDFIVICVRRLVEKNGVIFAVKAMNELESYQNIKLIIIGDGPEKNNIVKEIKNKNAIYLGAIDNEDVIKYYNVANIALVPSVTSKSLQEATSISALEALSFGLPTIVSSIGGLKEIIVNNKNGILVSEKDYMEIATNILSLYNDNTFTNNISINSRKSILENYSHTQAAKKYYDFFTKAD